MRYFVHNVLSWLGELSFGREPSFGRRAVIQLAGWKDCQDRIGRTVNELILLGEALAGRTFGWTCRWSDELSAIVIYVAFPFAFARSIARPATSLPRLALTCFLLEAWIYFYLFACV